MINEDFVQRLNKAFDKGSMADVARQLGIPHATVRNYYLGRLPAPEVLIKIARATGISLNWLLLGSGDMYASQNPPVNLGRFLEDKIAEIVDRRLADLGIADRKLESPFDIEESVVRLDDPQLVMQEWFKHEGLEYPLDFGLVFFEGWETFSPEKKVSAIRDAKRAIEP